MIVVSQTSIDAFVKRGAWNHRRLDQDLDDVIARVPEREAVIDPPNRDALLGGAQQRWTYGQLDRFANVFAAQLLARGLKKDDVLLVQLPNCVEQIAAYVACMRLGIVITPVAIQYREHELRHILNVSQARAVLTSTIAGVDHPAMFRGLGVEVLFSLDDFLGTPALEPVHEARRAHPPTAFDVVTLCWTSGTEGIPKGVPRNHNEWRVIGDGVSESVGLADGVRLLNPFPLTNMGGIGGLMVPWILRAGTLVQHHPFALPVFLKQLREERVDYTVAPPALLNMLLQKAELLAGIDFQRLKSIGSGSAPLSEWMVRGYFEKFGVQIINYFGSNEGTSLMSTPVDIADPALRATYFPRFGVKGLTWSHPLSALIETRLVDPVTNQVIEQPGRPGELRITGAAMFAGYYRQPDLNSAAFDADGFFRTGDLFEIGGAKNELYRFVGRLKDIIIRGGVNISAEEIETLLLEHPAVAEAAVIGYPDVTLGEKMCAVLVAKKDVEPPTLSAVIDFLRHDKKVAAFKLPERLELVAALPRNPMGKVQKTNLRAKYR